MVRLTAKPLLVCGVAALALAGAAGASHGGHSGAQPRHAVAGHRAKAPIGIIVPQRGMLNVTLGMTRSGVISTLGTPNKTRRASNFFGAYTVYRYKGVSIIFQDNAKATTITTHSRRLETASGVGVGVGDTESAVRAGVPGVKCRTSRGVRSCLLGLQKTGHRLTVFLFKKGLVNRITIGFVLD